MLLVVIMLILVHTMITTVVDPSKALLKDTARLSQARLSTEKLANSVKEVSAALGDAKKTIHITLPSKTKIVCATPNIKFEIKDLSDGDKEKSFATGTGLICSPSGGIDNSSDTSKTYAVTITKNASAINLNFAEQI